MKKIIIFKKVLRIDGQPSTIPRLKRRIFHTFKKKCESDAIYCQTLTLILKCKFHLKKFRILGAPSFSLATPI